MGSPRDPSEPRHYVSRQRALDLHQDGLCEDAPAGVGARTQGAAARAWEHVPQKRLTETVMLDCAPLGRWTAPGVWMMRRDDDLFSNGSHRSGRGRGVPEDVMAALKRCSARDMMTPAPHDSQCPGPPSDPRRASRFQEESNAQATENGPVALFLRECLGVGLKRPLRSETTTFTMKGRTASSFARASPC